MSFDDEIDALKQSIEEDRGDAHRASVAALEELSAKLMALIMSRRVEFLLDDADEEDEPSLVVAHAATGEELGAVLHDAGGFSFESDDDDYFPDIDQTADGEAFAQQLYEILKTGLPVFELDVEADEEADEDA
ncbi:MAG: hypothetical protein MI723_05320 [Caulobacterales bacterium]|nr:hypothetical protein [Caulobacterales bacterium]